MYDVGNNLIILLLEFGVLVDVWVYGDFFMFESIFTTSVTDLIGIVIWMFVVNSIMFDV